MKARRGMALLAAMWLIVAIAAVALQFALVARERAVIGIAASDRGHDRASALGALAALQARMEYDIRNAATGTNVAATRAGDPWFGVDTIYTGTTYVDSIPVEVEAKDLGATVNINNAQEQELQLLFGFILNNSSTATALAQGILDWRDNDDNARSSGGERDDYLKDGLLVLPANGPFREVDDLIHVRGMTPEILEQIRPYVNTRGTAAYRVNLNSAPEPVLRSLPGMTDAILNQILSLRSGGRRITNVAQVMTASNRGQPVGGRGGNPQQQATQTQLTQRTTVTTTDVELTFYAGDITRPQPTKFVAIITRTGNNANITWQLW